MADYNLAVLKVLDHEAGYVNDPDDSGGETKYGISKRSYPNIDIANLTLPAATKIYKRDYWDRVKGDQIESQAYAEIIFDFAVNAGVRASSKIAQKCAGCAADGIIGPVSVKHINNTSGFTDSFTIKKIAHYVELCRRKPSQKKFLLGWLNRCLDYVI